MKRIDISLQQPHFIGSWNIDNNDLCRQIVDFFDKNKNLHSQGATQSGRNQNLKKTTDIIVRPNDLENLEYKCFKDYISELYKCFIDYQAQWPFLKGMIPYVDIGAFNIQKYSPGDHFSQVHTERSHISSLHRVFAWMTYLNDVDDGATTNFLHYDIKIKPQISKTLIWPADWTHAHSGEILNSGVKYIITGWMHWPYNKEDQDKI